MFCLCKAILILQWTFEQVYYFKQFLNSKPGAKQRNTDRIQIFLISLLFKLLFEALQSSSSSSTSAKYCCKLKKRETHVSEQSHRTMKMVLFGSIEKIDIHINDLLAHVGVQRPQAEGGHALLGPAGLGFGSTGGATSGLGKPCWTNHSAWLSSGEDNTSSVCNNISITK